MGATEEYRKRIGSQKQAQKSVFVPHPGAERALIRSLEVAYQNLRTYQMRKKEYSNQKEEPDV